MFEVRVLLVLLLLLKLFFHNHLLLPILFLFALRQYRDNKKKEFPDILPHQHQHIYIQPGLNQYHVHFSLLQMLMSIHLFARLDMGVYYPTLLHKNMCGRHCYENNRHQYIYRHMLILHPRQHLLRHYNFYNYCVLRGKPMPLKHHQQLLFLQELHAKQQKCALPLLELYMLQYQNFLFQKQLRT